MAKAEAAYDRGPREVYDTTLGWRFTNPRLAELHHPYTMGETGENVAERCGITRAEQDEFALRSHQRAVAAIEEGRFTSQIVPITVLQPKGEPIVVDRDEHPRPDTSLAALARLKAAFREGGSVTAGNSSGINDGSAALLVASEAAVERHGFTPLARVVAAAVAGVPPRIMGIGPIPATEALFARTGVAWEDIDVVELNEAFASQALACLRAFGLPDDAEHVNPNGGAIALGHPTGMSGARLAGTAMMELRRRAGRYAVATMCIGVGQGIAVLLAPPP
jgi:acetyl-CoA acetyltransferase family protein